MNGKVVVVTGATGTIGGAAAEAFARAGANVVLVARNAPKLQARADAIRQATGNKAVDVLAADLSDHESVRVAAELLRRRPRLHVLVNNAAVYHGTRIVSTGGLESMFATNHLGPFLLTTLLVDRLKASAPSRVIVVTAPSTTQLDFDDLQGARKFSALRAFGASKMCNLLFTFALARRLAR